MQFILGQLRQLGMVALIMACALTGTVGILKLIKKLVPDVGSRMDLCSKGPEAQEEKEGSADRRKPEGDAQNGG